MSLSSLDEEGSSGRYSSGRPLVVGPQDEPTLVVGPQDEPPLLHRPASAGETKYPGMERTMSSQRLTDFVESQRDACPGGEGSGSIDMQLWQRYQINLDRVLGSGTFGVVYSATDLNSGEEVAVKRMDLHDPGRSAEQNAYEQRVLFRELELLREVSDHPNTVRLYDCFVGPPGVLNVVMELCQGRDLSDVVRARGALSEREGQSVVTQLLAALAFCHDRGIVHRDIKPSNIAIMTALPSLFTSLEGLQT